MSNVITKEHVHKLLDNSRITTRVLFDKVTMVALQLPNGYVIVESSGCIDPANYGHELGKEYCMNKIIDKIYELEGYKAHG